MAEQTLNTTSGLRNDQNTSVPEEARLPLAADFVAVLPSLVGKQVSVVRAGYNGQQQTDGSLQAFYQMANGDTVLHILCNNRWTEPQENGPRRSMLSDHFIAFSKVLELSAGRSSSKEIA